MPGGVRGLQNRCEAPRALGGFDSHTLPPPCLSALVMVQTTGAAYTL